MSSDIFIIVGYNMLEIYGPRFFLGSNNRTGEMSQYLFECLAELDSPVSSLLQNLLERYGVVVSFFERKASPEQDLFDVRTFCWIHLSKQMKAEEYTSPLVSASTTCWSC